ncbi:MFS transporter [Pseudofrankia sp. BMG5.36]|uniref:MFS transporter n=1 Tax=Pseudofrankia sp. BMG5.36 TaxID=1834512 RepID=UPI0008D94C93|nr:MFS transporter [Pseudofrankia sp. BMG5.36]OHV65568.1 hypothetical protein BCD48_36535 [Pseudofrankia sp. BMG5.36]
MTAVDSPAATPGVVAPRRWLVLGLLATAQLMLVLDVTVVNVALPDIGAGLRLSRGAVAWVMTVYTLFFGGLMLAGGRLADRFGARRLALVGLVLFTASSALTGTAQSAAALLVGRALQGAAAAVLSPAALATALAVFRGPARQRALAVWSGLAGIGSALGVVRCSTGTATGRYGRASVSCPRQSPPWPAPTRRGSSSPGSTHGSSRS